MMEGLQKLEEIRTRTRQYEELAKKKLFDLINQSDFKVLSSFSDGKWQTDEESGNDYLMFDFKLPAGHLEFTVELSGWGHSLVDHVGGMS